MYRDSRSYQVLVVEDNPGDMLLVEDYLAETMPSARLIQAESFGEARAVLARLAQVVDVILLDLTLPDKSGEGLINDMISIAGQAPVVILTGYTSVDFAIKSLSLGATDYLVKDELNASILYKSIIYNIERNNNLRSLKASEQRYADLFHLSPQPMWVYALDSLRFLDVNDAAIRHYGYSREEFLAMTLPDIRPLADHPRAAAAASMTQEEAAHYGEGEFHHLKKNGDLIYVDIRSNFIWYKGKKAELVLVNDITERYLHTQAIEAQNARLREIAWIQSHVVRAPLARLQAIVDLIHTLSLTPAELDTYLSFIESSAQELDAVVKEIIAKAQQVEIEYPGSEGPAGAAQG